MACPHEIGQFNSISHIFELGRLGGGNGGWDVWVVMPVSTTSGSVPPIHFAPPVCHDNQQVADYQGNGRLVHLFSDNGRSIWRIELTCWCRTAAAIIRKSCPWLMGAYQNTQVTTPHKAVRAVADMAQWTRRRSLGGRLMRHKNLRGTMIPMISDRKSTVNQA
jgi:hypothetical protein